MGGNRRRVWFSTAAALCVLATTLALPGTAWAATRGVTVAGGNGAGDAANQLAWPMDVLLDPDGTMYIGDQRNARVQRWARGASEGVTVAGGHGHGDGLDQLYGAVKIARDAAGDLIIPDPANRRVMKWTPGAAQGEAVISGVPFGDGPGELGPNFDGIAVGADGSYLIADTANSRIQKWAPGATSGVTVAGGNGAGDAANQLKGPLGLALDESGNLYIADHINGRVQKWAPGATQGTTVAGRGLGTTSFDLMRDVAVDQAGNVYALDYSNAGGGRVTKWAPGATEGVVLAGGSGSGSGPDQFALPFGLTVDAFGNVFVADTLNHRVQKWDPVAPVAAPVITPSPDANGWHSEPVTVTWHWSDEGGVGVDPAACPATTAVPATAEVTGECTDLGGNTATAGPLAIKVDATPPAAAPSVDGATVQWNWADADSGLGPDCAESSTATGLGAHTLAAQCADLVGHVGEASAQVVVRAAPKFTVSPTSVVAGGELTVTGEGFLPGEPVELSVLSTPIGVGAATADNTGAFVSIVALPPGLTSGEHLLRATGTRSELSLEAPFNVLALPAPSPSPTPTVTPTVTPSSSPAPTLPDTGTGAVLVLAVTALVLLGAGVLAVAAARRSTHNT